MKNIRSYTPVRAITEKKRSYPCHLGRGLAGTALRSAYRKCAHTFIAALLSLVLSLSPDLAAARGPFALEGYSGGMMLHTGWVGGATARLCSPAGAAVATRNMAGMPYGIGGSLRLYFGPHLRVGAEGYASYLRYGDFGSRAGMGWGGLLVDWQFHAGRLHPFAGVTVGGGSLNNLTLTSPAGADFVVESGVSYRRYGFAAVAPFVGIEYELSDRFRLVVKADCILNVSNPQPDFPVGPRIYVGFNFFHGRR